MGGDDARASVGDGRTIMASRTCEDCRWWQVQPTETEQGTNTAVGYCRRWPPQRRDNGVGAWPITFQEDWCGEYLHRDDAAYGRDGATRLS